VAFNETRLNGAWEGLKLEDIVGEMLIDLVGVLLEVRVAEGVKVRVCVGVLVGVDDGTGERDGV